MGSNISPRRQYISKSLSLLEKRFPDQFRSASYYETEPFQNTRQQPYINTAACFACDLQPLELLSITSAIELAVGRIRSGVKWEPRTIDIDILLRGDDIVRTPQLTIPHYDLSNRDFFLVPLLELSSALVHPQTGEPLDNLLKKIPIALRTHPGKIGVRD